MKLIKLSLILITAALVSFTFIQRKPVLYIIGDSTVKNGNGNPNNKQQGWGSWIYTDFDTMRISISNQAIGGRSSRTFLTEGRWTKVLETLQPGDYVLMQFGHNDSSPLDDTARARGTIRGIGNDSTEIYNPIRKMKEVVYSYGWYMRKFINETKAKGAVAIVCSPIPRDNWKNGKLQRDSNGYALWSKQVAQQTGAYFIDLHNSIADVYDTMDSASIKKLFPDDNTHTNKEGALINVQKVVEGIKGLSSCDLKNYVSNK